MLHKHTLSQQPFPAVVDSVHPRQRFSRDCLTLCNQHFAINHSCLTTGVVPGPKQQTSTVLSKSRAGTPSISSTSRPVTPLVPTKSHAVVPPTPITSTTAAASTSSATSAASADPQHADSGPLTGEEEEGELSTPVSQTSLAVSLIGSCSTRRSLGSLLRRVVYCALRHPTKSKSRLRKSCSANTRNALSIC